jgi:3-hydroxyisobutyrate dehydrogenase
MNLITASRAAGSRLNKNDRGETGMRVGFVGLGSMGGDQVKCLAASGFDLTVFDVYAPSMEVFSGAARLAGSVAEVGQDADLVGVCVRDEKQVRDTLEGQSGLIANMKRGSIILIHSTLNPDTVHDLGRQAGERGIDLIDAAVSRTEHNKPGPFVYVMAGGDEAVLNRARPVLEAYATGILHAGSLGAGMAVKIANNLFTWVSIVTASQAFRLAAASGVNPDALVAVMTGNGNLTPTLKGFAAGMLSRERNTAFDDFMESQAGIGEKDLSLAIEFAEASGVTVPVAEAARDGMRAAMTRK